MTINNKNQLAKNIDSFWSDNCFHGVTQTFNSEVAFWIERGNGESEQENNRRVEMYTQAKDEILENIYSNSAMGNQSNYQKKCLKSGRA